MKAAVSLEEALNRTREKTDQVRTALGFVPSRRPRSKPRSPGETLALCRDVFERVERAKKEGRFVKLSPTGYMIRWEK